jgi:acetyltransferase-like isoleucine patch superfamily enzyme
MSELAGFQRIAPDVKLGRDVRIFAFVNLYGCEIGDETKIGTFVEIQKGATIGSRCKISSHTFVCEGVTIESEVFVGHGVTFINDRNPMATNAAGELQTEADWECQKTVVKRGASIGSGVTVLGGITIGEMAVIGAGSVVTKDVPPHTTVVGNPARPLKRNG